MEELIRLEPGKLLEELRWHAEVQRGLVEPMRSQRLAFGVAGREGRFVMQSSFYGINCYMTAVYRLHGDDSGRRKLLYHCFAAPKGDPFPPKYQADIDKLLNELQTGEDPTREAVRIVESALSRLDFGKNQTAAFQLPRCEVGISPNDACMLALRRYRDEYQFEISAFDPKEQLQVSNYLAHGTQEEVAAYLREPGLAERLEDRLYQLIDKLEDKKD